MDVFVEKQEEDFAIKCNGEENSQKSNQSYAKLDWEAAEAPEVSGLVSAALAEAAAARAGLTLVELIIASLSIFMFFVILVLFRG